MKLFTRLGVPLLLLAQGFTLVVTTKTGGTNEYDTQNIESITFEEEKSGGFKKVLASPELTVKQEEPGEVNISWTAVPNAGYYRTQLDEDEATVVAETEVTLSGMPSGSYTFSVTALPADSKSYKESAPASVTFDYVAPEGLSLRIRPGEVTSTSIPYNVKGASGDYYVGIVPRTPAAMTDAELISYINTHPEAQRKKYSANIDGEAFTDLTPSAHYILVAYPVDSTDEAVRYFTRTYIDCTPGTKGSVFPFGVDEKSGFIDVDKVGKLDQYGWTGEKDKNDDGGMCWACTASGLLQWFLNDYVTKTGHEYPLVHPEAIAKESKCYSTPLMDLLNDAFAYSELGAGPMQTIMWFLAGYYDHPVIGNATDPNTTDIIGAPFRKGYKYWKGGFGGMTWREAQNYLVTNEEANQGWEWYDHTRFYDSQQSLPKDVTLEESARKFSRLTIDALMQGPFCLNFAGHAMSCWGCDYEIMADGTPRIYNFYYCENAIHPTNVHGGYQMGPVTYEAAGYPPHLLGKNVAHCANKIGGKYVILNTYGFRGWQPYF